MRTGLAHCTPLGSTSPRRQAPASQIQTTQKRSRERRQSSPRHDAPSPNMPKKAVAQWTHSDKSAAMRWCNATKLPLQRPCMCIAVGRKLTAKASQSSLRCIQSTGSLSTIAVIGAIQFLRAVDIGRARRAVQRRKAIISRFKCGGPTTKG